MSQTQNPYSSPLVPSVAAVSKAGRMRRILTLLCIASAGTCIGSYVSAELLYLHYPDETRTLSRVIRDTTEALVTSPLSMTFGVIPTLGFYGTHGFLVIPGVLMAMSGCVVYYRHPSPVFMVVALTGFALWSHNNYLSFHALMSV